MMERVNLSGGIKNEDWISSSETPDPTPLPQVPGRFILIRPVPLKEKIGSLIIPDAVIRNMELMTTVGRVLAMGPLTYTDPRLLVPEFLNDGPRKIDTAWDIDRENGVVWTRRPWCAVGDFVGYAKFAGARFVYKNVKLLQILDEDVRLVVSAASDLDPTSVIKNG